MPFLYLNNYLWTINFAKGRLKMIFYNFAITFCINIIADIILIPYFKAEGAAAGYLLAIIGQSVFYWYQTGLPGLKKASVTVLICPAAAMASGLLATRLFDNILAVLFTAIGSFILLSVITRQLRISDQPVLKRIAGR